MKYEKISGGIHLYWSYQNFIDLSKKLTKKLELNNASELIRILITDSALKNGLLDKDQHEVLSTLAIGKSGAAKRNK